MTTNTALCAAMLGASLGFLSCKGPQGPVASQQSEFSKPAAARLSPHWVYLPSDPARLRARQDLGDAILLFVGDAGERWLVDAKAGSAIAAAILADENLVGVARPDEQTFVFVGDRGTLYRASTPLGPFDDIRRVQPPPQQLAAAGRFVIALQWDGSVQRSEDGGRTFARVSLAAERPLALALAPDGRAMIASYPEQLWLSADAGESWRQSGLPTLGVGFVGVDADGSLVARGMRGAAVWRAGRDVVLSERPFERPPLDLLTDLGPAPSADAVAEGRARITGDGYVEVGRNEEDGPWWISWGAIDERLVRMPIANSEECKQMVVAARGRVVALGCLSAPRRGGVLFPSLRLMMSRDRGLTFTSRVTGLVADEVGLHMHVLPDATLLITGGCKPDDEGICAPSVPLKLVQASEDSDGQFLEVKASKAPPVLGRVGPVVASPSGKRLYATALLAADRSHAVLISDDGGVSFRAVRLDLDEVKALRTQEGEGQREVAESQPGELRVGSEGSLSWVLVTRKGPVWLVLDQAARLVSAHGVPEDQPHLVAQGRRGLALGDEKGRVFESEDGGRSYRQAAQLPLEAIVKEGVPRVACGQAGCVFGATFVRAGWGVVGGGIVPGAPEVAEPAPKLRTPIVCEVQQENMGQLEGVLEQVTAASAAQGAVAWSAVLVDRRKASVSVAHASARPQPRVEVIPLLAPVPQASSYALEARPQAEGAAAMRYRVVRDAEGKVKAGTPMMRIEVAWDNLFEGGLRRAIIPTAGVLRDEDVSAGLVQEAAVAKPRILSVSVGGIFVCPHARCDGPQSKLLFLDAKGAQRAVSVPPWPSASAGLNTELSFHMIRTAAGEVPIAFGSGLPVVLRARARGDAGYDYPALGLLAWDAEQRGWNESLTWAFGPPEGLALAFTAWHDKRGAAFARVLRFGVEQGVASTSPAPTQSDLGDPPAVCAAAQRQDAERVVGPAQPSTRHPVLIRFPDGSGLQLRTDQAVMYGVDGQACAVVLDAAGTTGKTRPYRALVPLADLERAWLFEKVEPNLLAWKAMKCGFEPGATLDAPPPRPTTASAPLGGKRRPATPKDCDEIFDTMLPQGAASTSFNRPPAVLDIARASFLRHCVGKPVDMECVRRTRSGEQILQHCMSPSSN